MGGAWRVRRLRGLVPPPRFPILDPNAQAFRRGATRRVVAVEQAAKALGIELQILEARASTLQQTARSAAEHKSSALLLLGSPVLAASFTKVAEVTTASLLLRADEAIQ
jgi:hypothetical protein